MNRDEIILSCVEVVDNLVKKYNNHKSDEDLQSEGMIAVVECVDRCLSENMTDLSQIQARCNIWARNRILSEIYREKAKFSDDDTVIEMVGAEEDMTELLIYLEQVLTSKQKEIFNLLMLGNSREEIMQKLNIQDRTLRHHLKNIREKIKN